MPYPLNAYTVIKPKKILQPYPINLSQQKKIRRIQLWNNNNLTGGVGVLILKTINWNPVLKKCFIPAMKRIASASSV